RERSRRILDRAWGWSRLQVQRERGREHQIVSRRRARAGKQLEARDVVAGLEAGADAPLLPLAAHRSVAGAVGLVPRRAAPGGGARRSREGYEGPPGPAPRNGLSRHGASAFRRGVNSAPASIWRMLERALEKVRSRLGVHVTAPTSRSGAGSAKATSEPVTTE